MSALLLLLLACGRPSTDADVRMVGVGNDPEQIGPEPTAYGGIVEYDVIDFAGAGLNLGHMGLGSFQEVGPQMITFAPPYQAVLGFSYIFDTRLPAGDTFSFVAPVPPVGEGTCYTIVEPQGPIGSFTTVDVGDYMRFTSDDGTADFKMSRIPADYPPDARDVSIYYLSFDEFAPTPRSHYVAGDGSTNPGAMQSQVYRPANFAFGQEISFQFPGAVTRVDQPVGSIPRPSSAAGDPRVVLPGALGGVLVEWLDKDAGAAKSACIEYYGGATDDSGAPVSDAGRATPPLTPADCETLVAPPSDEDYFDAFPGQIYPGPWDTSDGKLTFKWTPQGNGDYVSLAVRFMAPIDPTDPNYLVQRKDGRDVFTCEQDDADVEWVTDPTILDPESDPEDPELVPAMQGDPFSRMVEVSCLASESSGEFTLDQSMLADALEYVDVHPAGGVVFFFTRGQDNEVEVPAVKDSYDQLREITPIKVTARHTRIGRMAWDGGAE
jgi:hypothetical protein